MIRRIKKASLIAVSSLMLSASASTGAMAQAGGFCMGQVEVMGFGFCPRGWMDANGQLLPIAQYQSLFSIFGTMYGGDGRTTFGLPDLRGRAVVHVGAGAGIPPTTTQGAKTGSTSFQVLTSNLPSHTHSAHADPNPADNQNANGDLPGGGTFYRNSPSPSVQFNSTMIGHSGASQPINKRSPIQVLRYCVNTVGIFCSRN